MEEWAKYWADMGFSVVPVHTIKNGACSCFKGKECKSMGKHPALDWTQYQKKKADSKQIKEWFTGQYKGYNIGVVTGKISGNRYAVDVDVGEGKDGQDSLDDLCLEYDDLPETLKAISGSGGNHYFFKAPDSMEVHSGTNVLGSGVDVRGEGGFVVVAPSIHECGRHYKIDEGGFAIEQSPHWLSVLVDRSKFTYVNGTPMGNGLEVDKFGSILDGREGYMTKLVIGAIRTAWISSGKVFDEQGLFNEVWETYQRKVRVRGKTLDDDGRGEQLLRQKISYNLKKQSRNELKVLDGVVPNTSAELLPSTTLDRQPLSLPTEAGGRLNITDWGMENYAGEAPDQEWLIENILPKRIPGLIASMGGMGKSYILLDLALKVAGGELGIHSERALGGDISSYGKVVMFGAEDSKESVHRRIASIADQTLRDRAKGNLFVVPMPDAGGAVGLIQNVMGQYSITEQYLEIRKQLLEFDDLKLVIIDPLQAFAMADLNSDPAAGQYWWSMMSELAVAANCNILIAHHMRKDGSFSIRKSSQAREAIRGTTALVDGSRWTYSLWELNEADQMTLSDKLDFEIGVGNAVCGGVVKVNDNADKAVRTFIRAENGLLIDRSVEVSEILEAGTRLTIPQTQEIFREIQTRWDSDQPFALGANSKRSLQSYMKSELELPIKTVKSYINAWLNNNMISDEIHDKKTKKKGFKVIQIPGGTYND
jgi:hypothetical protein